MSSTHFKSIALLIRRDTSYGRDVIRGVGDVARAESWAVHTLPPTLEIQRSLHHLRPDGIISHLSGRAVLDAGASYPDIPLVDVSQHPLPATVAVLPDNRQIGVLAAEHMIERGLQNFAFLAAHVEALDSPRREGFETTVREAGWAFDHYFARAYGQSDWMNQVAEDRKVIGWLKGLGSPVGVFAGTDEAAAHLLRACLEAGLKVPHEVSVVGVHDDPMIVAMTRPPLSSVRTDPQRVGYQAARLLVDLLEGRKQPHDPVLIPPVGVTVRESSDSYSVEDPLLRSALNQIRGPGGESLDVNLLAQTLQVSRRTLERRFLAKLGRSPAVELSRFRLERAKRLLGDTNLPLADIAAQSGFGSATRLCEAFRLSLATTPAQFRSSFQRGR